MILKIKNNSKKKIYLKNVSKYFEIDNNTYLNEQVCILKNINTIIDKKLNLILGYSGEGKSVIINIIAKITNTEIGNVTYNYDYNTSFNNTKIDMFLKNRKMFLLLSDDVMWNNNNLDTIQSLFFYYVF